MFYFWLLYEAKQGIKRQEYGYGRGGFSLHQRSTQRIFNVVCSSILERRMVHPSFLILIFCGFLDTHGMMAFS